MFFYREDSMNMEKRDYEAPERKGEIESGGNGAAVQTIFERGAEAYGQAEEAVSDAYDKTSEKVSETYGKARNYGHDNPGKSILIALGIGVGLGFLLCSGTRRSGVTGRIARPVVNAISDIALDFWR
jgi:ElaB/YqjD/DUF883 family membrane-anchored ribosome-binding protein